MPRFWANSATSDFFIADLIMLGIGICFGAIHCIAWHFSFPTHIELLMWRISSVTITAVPVYIPLVFSLGGWLYNMNFRIFGIFLVFFWSYIWRYPVHYSSSGYFGFSVYISQRPATWSVRDRSLDYLHTSCVTYIYISADYLVIRKLVSNTSTASAQLDTIPPPLNNAIYRCP